MDSIHKKIFSGAVIMVGLRLLVKSLGLINTMILARLLMPSDFGLIALAMSVYAFIELLNAFGFDMVLIQNQNATKEHYNTSWTLKVIFGAIAGVVMLLVASPIAEFYNDFRLINLFYCLALMFVINGAVNIGVVNFRKELDFKTEFIYQISIKLLTVGLTIFLAFTLRNYWALALGMIASAIFEFTMSYILSRYRPSFALSKCKELYAFSIWLVLNNALMYMNLKVKDLIIGKMAGVNYVGLYSVGDEIASLASSEFVASINRATYPGYAKFSSNRSELQRLYLNVLSSIACIGVPASVGISLIAPIFIPLVLGDKWLEAIPIMQIIALANAFVCINTNAGYVFMAIGKPRLSTLLLFIRVVILISLMVYMIDLEGYVGAAKAVLATSLVMFPVYMFVIRAQIGIPIVNYLLSIARQFASAGCMYLMANYVFFDIFMPFNLSQPGEAYSIIQLFSLAGLGAAIFLVSDLALWLLMGRPDGLEKKLLSRFIKQA